MPDKPTTAAEYRADQVERVRSACLYIATILGDHIDDIVVVGGLVPSLLINQEALAEGIDRHVGTMDLDLGMKLAILTEQRYQALAERFRSAGFEPDSSDKGNRTRQRWKIEANGKVTVDFLIEPGPGDRGGGLRHLESDFAAIIASGLHLAFQDRQKIRVHGRTPNGEEAIRDVQVCGPGAFVVMKALAFASRGSNKDAYDLFYLVRNYANGVGDVVRRLEPIKSDPDTKKALEIIQRDFTKLDGIGPRRVAQFVQGDKDDQLQADVVSFMSQLLRELEEEV